MMYANKSYTIRLVSTMNKISKILLIARIITSDIAFIFI